MFGFIAIRKPAGSTSRQALDIVKRTIRPVKVGHTGTLDPMASGVLVVAVGPATRLTRYVHALKKTYIAEFRFGVTSESDDIETELQKVENAIPFNEMALLSELKNFEGRLEQVPPNFSAVKINGKRAYRLARSGAEFKIEPKTVEVFSISLLNFEFPKCRLKIVCGSGTYIRSIGRDLGARLNSGAVMTSLVRTKVGEFSIEDSISLEAVTQQKIIDRLVRPEKLFTDYPSAVFNNEMVNRLKDGKWFTSDELGVAKETQSVIAIEPSNRLLAILEKQSSGSYKPDINFVHYYLTN